MEITSKMILETKFDLLDKVKILELNKIGVVKSIYLSNLGLSYNIRYFAGEEIKEVYFYENELSAELDEKVLGFQTENDKKLKEKV
jgi:hypothetical protein